MSGHLRIGRVQVWIDCLCGAEITFEDIDPEGSVTKQCKECRRTAEVVAFIESEDISPDIR